MVNRRKPIQDVTLPLVDKFLPPDLAAGAEWAFRDELQKQEVYGVPVQFVRARALLFSVRIVLHYEVGRLIDWACSLRREQLSAANLEMSLVLTYGRNYAWIDCFADISMIMLFLFGALSFFTIYKYNVSTYFYVLPFFSKCLFSFLISVTPFLHKLIRHRTVIIVLHNIGLLCWIFGLKQVLFLLWVFPADQYYRLDLGVFHLYGDSSFLCIFTAAVAHPIIRHYVSRSVEFRSPEKAKELQMIFDHGSGSTGWYSGNKNVRNLLDTTKHHTIY